NNYQSSPQERKGPPPTTTIHIRSVGVNLVRSTLDGCIVVRSMSSSIIVLGCPVRPISRVAYPARDSSVFSKLLHAKWGHSTFILRSLACFLKAKPGLFSEVRCTTALQRKAEVDRRRC